MQQQGKSSCTKWVLPVLSFGILYNSPIRAQNVPANTAAPIVLHCPSLIDTLSGKVLGATTVVIEGERINEVVPGAESRPGATVIELPGETCIPGLIDAHVHLASESRPGSTTEAFYINPADVAMRSTVYAKRTLLAGFTTVRNLGDANYETVSLRNEINSGWIPGPRIYTAGKAIGTTGGHADPTDGLRLDLQGNRGPEDGIINGPIEAAKAVRQHYKEGVDVIKIMSTGGVMDQSSSVDNAQMTQEEINAAVATAHDYGYTVAVHAQGAEGVRRAVLGGVDSVEHGTFMTDSEIRLIKEHNTFYVPTVYAAVYLSEKAKIPGYYPPAVTPKALAVGPQILKTVTAAYKAGVKFAYGTDSGIAPHGENWHDFPLLVQCGVPPMAAIQMATVNASQLLRHEKDFGSITPGKFADVVAVPGDPLKDINLMGRVDFVMKAGHVYKRDGKETVFESANQ